jgi:benzodiazapine receptor
MDMEIFREVNKIALIVGNILSWFAAVIVGILYNSGKLHYHPSYVSQLYPTKFTPANWAFGLWTVVFLLTGVFIIYQALPVKRESHLIFIRIGPFFIINYLLMFTWMFCYSFNAIWASFIFMVGILATMSIIYFRLGINYSVESRDRFDYEGTPLSKLDFWILQVPFSFSLGWIILLTFSNLLIAVSSVSPSLGWSQQGWSVVFQIFTAIIALLFMRIRHDPFFAIPISWGLFGIADRFHNDDIVDTSALVLGVLIGITALFTVVHVLFIQFYKVRYAQIGN